MITQESIRRWISWPFKTFLKLLTGCIFLGYVMAGITATGALYEKNLYRAQDIEAINAIISDSADKGNTMPVAAWLSARPLTETDKLVEVITPKGDVLGPAIFFEIFRRELKLGRPEEALFWLQLGRFRLRYDVLRCNGKPAAAKTFDELINIKSSSEINELLQEHPEDLKKALQRVLDFDEKYPANDDPKLFCKTINSETPDDTLWWAYHHVLRQKTEEFIKGTGKASPL